MSVNNTFQFSQLFNHHSKLADDIRQFYLDQEELHEKAPLAPSRHGQKLKGSDFYIEMQLLTEQEPVKKRNYSTEIRVPHKKSLFSWIPFKERFDDGLAKIRNPFGRKGLNKEVEESRTEIWTESNAKQRESWKKIFSGIGQRIVFKGGAGSGKSFSLSQEVRQRLTKARSRLESFSCSLNDLDVPIFVKAGVIIASKKPTIEEIIFDSLFESPKSVSPQLIKWFNHAFSSENGRRLFIVIDGLDELPETSLSRFRELTNQLNKYESATLVVSCRTMYFEERRDWISWTGDRRTNVVELAPLDEKQQSELINKLIEVNNNSKQTLLNLLEKNFSLNHFCRIPFVMTSACLLYSESKLTEETSYGSLYEVLTRKFLRGEWKDWGESEQRPEWMKNPSKVFRKISQNNRLMLLSQISWFLFEASPSENRFTLEQWFKAYEKASEIKRVDDPAPEVLLDELISVGMVLIAGSDSSGNREYFSFAHRTILEYFAASGLLNQFEKKVWVKTLTKHIWCENDWIEVIRFAASITDDSTLLLQDVAKDSGYISVRKRPLQTLENICLKLRACIVVFLVAFIGISLFIILSSKNTEGHLEKYFTQRKPYLDNFESLWQNSDNNLTLLKYKFENRESTWNDIWDFSSFALTEFHKYYPVLKDEIRSVYDYTFQFLRSESLQTQETLIGTSWSFLVDKMQYWLPVLIIGVLVLTIMKWMIAWSDRNLFYWIYKEKRDDIFLTGLRMQAEIIGYSNEANEVQDKNVQRIIRSLLNSTKMHGASDEEIIPEDILRLLRSKKNAREKLNAYWISLIDKRYRLLKRYNWTYEKLKSGYLFLIHIAGRKKVSPSFTKTSFKRLPRLADKILSSNRYDLDTKLLSDHIYSQFSADLQKLTRYYSRKKWTDCVFIRMFYRHLRIRNYRLRFGLLRRYSKQRKEKLITGLAESFNTVLQDRSLFTEERFSSIRLRTETKELLKQAPIDEKFIYLNRLLLEDAYPNGIKKIRRKWLLFIGWFGRIFIKNQLLSQMRELRYMENNSTLFRAFRGLKLIPNKENRNLIVNLLEESSKSVKHLIDNNRTPKRFTNLDLAAATTLAILDKSKGKKILAEIAENVSYKDEIAPLAIKELSKLDEKRAIELALVNLNKKRERDYYFDIQEFYSMLSDLPYETVAAELTRLSAEEEHKNYFQQILVPFLKKVSDEAAIEWLQKLADDKSQSFLADAARQALKGFPADDQSEGDKWADSLIFTIKNLLARDDYGSAVSEFDKLISPSAYEHSPEGFFNNSRKIAGFCKTSLLEQWIEKYGDRRATYKNLAVLANESEGKKVRSFLINLAKDINSRNYYSDIKGSVWLALGDLNDSDENDEISAEETLIRVLEEIAHFSYFFKSRFQENRKRHNLIGYLLGGLEKIGSDKALRQIMSEITSKSWITYYIAARLLADRDDPTALKFLLTGERLREKSSWEEEFGDEPKIRDLALQFGARIMKGNFRGFNEYIVSSQSRNSRFRIKA